MRKLTLISVLFLSFSFANKAIANESLMNAQIISLFNSINEALNLVILTTTNGEFKLDDSYTHLTAADFALIWNPATSHALNFGKVGLAGSVIICVIAIFIGGGVSVLPPCAIGIPAATFSFASFGSLFGALRGVIDALANGGDTILDIHSNHVDPDHLMSISLELHYRLLYNDYTKQANVYDTGSCSFLLSFDELEAHKIKYEVPECPDHDDIFLQTDYAAIREDLDPQERVVISDYMIITDELKFLIDNVGNNSGNIDTLR